MPKDAVRRVVRANIGQIRACSNHGPARDPGLAGRVALDFTSAPDGHVRDVGIAEDTVPDRSVGLCIAEAARAWGFALPFGSLVVRCPFVREPG